MEIAKVIKQLLGGRVSWKWMMKSQSNRIVRILTKYQSKALYFALVFHYIQHVALGLGNRVNVYLRSEVYVTST